jgi:hypothetical protein
MQFGYLGKGHKIFSKDEDGEGDGFELKVALLLEDDEGEDHDEGALETGLPKPLEEITNGEVLN